MSFAVSSSRTMAGARRIAAQRRAEQIAQRATILHFRAPKAAPKPMRIPTVAEVARARHLAFLAGLEPSRRSSAKSIVEHVAALHDLTTDDLAGYSRRVDITAARYDAIVEVRRAYPEMSLPWIAQFFRRDHTTILHALRSRGLK